MSSNSNSKRKGGNGGKITVADPGFLKTLYLKFRALDPYETYGGWYWTPIEGFYEKNFSIEVCEKNFVFETAPPSIFFCF